MIPTKRIEHYMPSDKDNKLSIIESAFSLSRAAHHKFINTKRIIASCSTPTEDAQLQQMLAALSSVDSSNDWKLYSSTVKNLLNISPDKYNYCVKQGALKVLHSSLTKKMPSEQLYDTLILVSNLASISSECHSEFADLRKLMLSLYFQFSASYQGNNLLLLEAIIWGIHNLINTKNEAIEFATLEFFNNLTFLSSIKHCSVKIAIYNVITTILTYTLQALDLINGAVKSITKSIQTPESMQSCIWLLATISLNKAYHAQYESVIRIAIALLPTYINDCTVIRPIVRLIGNMLASTKFESSCTVCICSLITNSFIVKDVLWVLSLMLKYDADTIISNVNLDFIVSLLSPLTSMDIRKECAVFIYNCSSVESGKYWYCLLEKNVLNMFIGLVNPVDIYLCTLSLSYIVKSLCVYPQFRLTIDKTKCHDIELLAANHPNEQISDLCNQICYILE